MLDECRYMNSEDLTSLRLAHQQISRQDRTGEKELVSWMGAMQAQDLEMAKWAVGVRLPGTDCASVELAMDRGEILRTHVMRPTWHLVCADDIYWLLELTAPQILASSRSRHKQLEITPALVSKSNRVIIDTINRCGGHATREEICLQFERRNIDLNDNRAAHLLLLAELDGLVCSGRARDGKPTYALLAERVKKPSLPTREEALYMLARRYFLSHGPATTEDFIWWSGLPVRDAKRAVEALTSGVNSGFSVANIGPRSFLVPDGAYGAASERGDSACAHLLPAYDEFIISYRDRSDAIPRQDHFRKAVSNNGVFRPVIVVDGTVRGIWKRSVRKQSVEIKTEFFETPSPAVLAAAEEKSALFGAFLGKTPDLVHNPR